MRGLRQGGHQADGGSPGGWWTHRRVLVGLSAALAVAVAVAVGVVAVVRDGQAQEYRRGTIVILTGGTKGIYYSYGVELAAAINRRLDGVRAEALATTASVDNVRRVARSANVFAFTAADAASAAVDGRLPFTAPVPIRALARIYDDYLHLVVRADAPIKEITDLVGKRVSMGSDGSGTGLIAERMLGVAGVDPATLAVSHLGINESVDALLAGQIDAFFWSGGLPTEGITELTDEAAVRLVPLGQLATGLRATWDPAYRMGTIPGDTYRLAEPGHTLTVAVPNLIVTRADTDSGLVEEVIRILFGARGDIAERVPVAIALDHRSAIATSPLPLHDGALRYYRAEKI
ncbi:TAXI family TRAP transporter solute-binding subunit [Frankia sp. CNm7]|uniref:TAXI family TRAP transporter solute-binding subunit n=1 Tax=Frankia nepalensis TaxID=1836974 RepID=A0A937RLR5_9ACTN|nr:TAXI family TRAP transporter solute-binding subunit [Frankia nepalensis]MBL7501207.1 TAXI family TRAP transporter solute-binding subunit [Frankia nepalensis]MBL7511607.1 TAXI family TRAP transporter solute-binding subunit [Frankia nepalensis]MBL7518882.1 TAXI family TRAP transporter solute-binding subunit [Frankia nepalensis]MBL7631225.1 TAXI family TRAP transporter solute-binding subunit [Frankia nepalensis]